MTEKRYMERALQLAEKGRGSTSPNPMVGAVIVKNGEMVGEGYHRAPGEPHAEIHALDQAGRQAKGATMYVSLEPCAHYGRTPPCTEAIIEAGIKKVVIAIRDPNPDVEGEGVERLREAGMEVEVGLLEDRARRLNEIFLKYVKTGRPFVVLKNAVSLDGKLATKTGESRWLSGEESRQIVHQLRDQLDAILVGLGTVIADNPRLTARTPDGGSDPIRIILDSNLSVPLESKVLNLKSSAPTIIAAAAGKGMEEKREKLEERGVELIRTEGKRVELNQLLQVLGDREITSLLVEGGSRVNTSFWEEKLVDKLYYFIAPKILGGGNAPPAVAGKGVDNVGQAINIVEKEVSRVGEDILIIGYPNYAADRKG